MKRILTHEQYRRLLVERRAERVCNRERCAARRYREVHEILARALSRKPAPKDERQREIPL